jgi:hypothetical protein
LGLWVRDAWLLRRADGVPPWARRQAALFLVLVVNYAVNGMFQDVSIIVMIHMVLFFMAGLNAGLAPLAASQPAPQLKLYPAAA